MTGDEQDRRIAACGLTVPQWAQERLANSKRIADLKLGDERESWLEDAAYWEAIVQDLLTLASLRVQGAQPSEAVDPSPAIAQQEAVITRMREVYPLDRKPCAWCSEEGESHHFDCPAETQAAIEADLNKTHPDIRPCVSCGKPQREHSYVGDYCLPHPVYSPVVSEVDESDHGKICPQDGSVCWQECSVTFCEAEFARRTGEDG